MVNIHADGQFGIMGALGQAGRITKRFLSWMVSYKTSVNIYNAFPRNWAIQGSGVPNDGFLQNTCKTLFRLFRKLLDL